jgi:hypothetical protein
MPRARALIDGASLGPDALKAATRAFDEAWAEIAAHFSHDQIQLEGARFSLANAVLSVTSDDSRDVEVLKRAALQIIANNYSSLPIAAKIKLTQDAVADEAYWLRRAEQTRILAQTASDPLVQNELRDVAFAYERIARLTAAKANKPRPA